MTGLPPQPVFREILKACVVGGAYSPSSESCSVELSRHVGVSTCGYVTEPACGDEAAAAAAT